MRREDFVAVFLTMLAMGCKPEAARNPNAVQDARSQQNQLKAEEAQQSADQANAAAAEMSETLRMVEESLTVLGAEWPHMQQLAQDFETGVREGHSNRDTLRQMLEQLATMQMQFERRATEAEGKLSEIQRKADGLKPEAFQRIAGHLETTKLQLQRYVEDNKQLRETLLDYKTQLEDAKAKIGAQEETIKQQQVLIEEQKKRIEEKNRGIGADENAMVRVRIATIADLRRAGVITGCRICTKRPFCGGCGCEVREMPGDGVFIVPAPLAKVKIFSIHPDGSFSKQANGPYQTTIRIPEGAFSEFWKLSDCLIIGY
jgi:hypothetical protein